MEKEFDKRERFLVIAVFLFFVALFLISPPEGVDWRRCFYQVAQDPLHPYDNYLFINPPWTVLALLPFRLFSDMISLAVSSSLGFVIIGLLVIKRNGSVLSVALALTSFPFLSVIANGNIEWLPAIGFILQDKWGLPFILAKPQTGILAILSWDSFWKNYISFVVPAAVVMIVSFAVWGNWPLEMLINIQDLQNAPRSMSTWNASLFPWSVPVGLALLYYIVKYRPADSEIFGIIATLCLIPYFAMYSLTILFALISVAHRRIAMVLWVLLWLYPILMI